MAPTAWLQQELLSARYEINLKQRKNSIDAATLRPVLTRYQALEVFANHDS
jgi:hypothetical protein